MQPNRRQFLVSSTVAALAAACGNRETLAPIAPHSAGLPAPSASSKKKILILGGTAFVGPEFVEAARGRGHTITLFNRGKTNPQLFPDLEKLHGDRKTGDLSALNGRRWDVILDTSGYVPRAVRESATLLKSADQYIFISSISAYDKPPMQGVDETGKVGELTDPNVEKVDEKTYGPLKVACERAAEAAMPGKVTVVRPGLIVGPGDPTDRFTYWPVRVAAGGEIMAPGAPADPVQFIDVRDLAAWLVIAVEARHLGVYNAVGPREQIGVGAMLEQMKAASGSKGTFTWVDAPFLEGEKVEPWSDMPVWVPPSGEDGGLTHVSSARAIAKGMTFRSVGETTRATLAWWNTLPEERRAKMRAGISREREAQVLAAFHKRAKAS